MDGRTEQMLKVEDKLQRMMQSAPLLLREYYYAMANYTHNTKLQYIYKINNFFNEVYGMKWGDAEIRRLSSVRIDQYITKRKMHIVRDHKLGNEVLAMQVTAVSLFYDFLVKRGYVKENPFGNSVGRPTIKPLKDVIYMEYPEVKEVMDNIQSGIGSSRSVARQKKWRTRDMLLLLIPLTTGMRVSALVGINLDDVDLAQGVIHTVEKGDNKRDYAIPQEVVEVAERWMAERKEMVGDDDLGALFITRTGGGYGRMTVRTVERTIGRYTDSLPKHITPHKLRSTYGTFVYRESGDLKMTSELLGHKQLSTTKRYAATDLSRKKEVQGAVFHKIFDS